MFSPKRLSPYAVLHGQAHLGTLLQRALGTCNSSTKKRNTFQSDGATAPAGIFPFPTNRSTDFGEGLSETFCRFFLFFRAKLLRNGSIFLKMIFIVNDSYPYPVPFGPSNQTDYVPSRAVFGSWCFSRPRATVSATAFVCSSDAGKLLSNLSVGLPVYFVPVDRYFE